MDLLKSHIFYLLMAALWSSCGRVGYELAPLHEEPLLHADDSSQSDPGTNTETDHGYGPDTDTDTDTDKSTDTVADTDRDTATDISLDDPLGDSSNYSFVFPYRGQIWLGPQTDGTGAVHAAPGSSAFSPASFSFFKDSSGDNTHSNDAQSPYPSIGTTGCAVGTGACGPDNEDGRGVFTSGTIRGEEWLVVSGARESGDLDYIYMTKDTDATLDFSYVDLSAVMGPQTKGISSLHVFDDRVYIGAPDTGGKRPYLVMLKNAPQGTGLNAAGNLVDRTHDEACDISIHDACTLRAELIPGIGHSTDMSMIDAIFDYNGRLYIANSGGIARSTVAAPLDAFNYPDHWTEVTPTSADYSALESVTTDKVANLEPADKAVPAMAAFGGELFFARNTEAGPQLWACAPDLVTGPAPATDTDCDPGDWRLVAANTNSDTSLTQFNNTPNTHISLLAATDEYLYVGFNNETDGIAVFRTSNPSPSGVADFTGKDGCAAHLSSSDCEGIGGNGLGLPANSRIFSHAFSTAGSKEYLYLVVGDGIGAIKVSLLIR